MKLKTFDLALEYIYSFIPTGTTKLYPGIRGLDRTKLLLSYVGSPQNKLKIVHIAGTSGKGSTVYLTSILLKAHGFRVGLHISPHLLDIRERVQIDNQMLSRAKFLQYINELVPAIEKTTQSEYGKPTYAEVLTSLAFYSFWKEGVDYAVIETNLGGLLDMTNSVSNPDKLCVITRLGFDHVKILGNRLADIAAQKAGIIQPGNRVVALYQLPQANKVIEDQCQATKSALIWVKPSLTFSKVNVSADSTVFNYELSNYRSTQKIIWKNLKLGLIGAHQAENASLSLTAVIDLARINNFQIEESKIRQALKGANWPGRFEQIQIQGKILIMDGAHNPQKMSSLIKTLKTVYPDSKPTFLVSFKHDKNFTKMLQMIAPKASKIYLTSFFTSTYDWNHLSAKPDQMKKSLERLNFKNIEIFPDSKTAFKKAFSETKDILVITGSIYFISEIYPLINQ